LFDCNSNTIKKAKTYKINFKEGTPQATYNVILKESSNNSLTFADENINIDWIFSNQQLSFVLNNKTGNPIKIDWNQVSYVDISGNAQRVMHEGVKYAERNEHLTSSLIPPTAKLEDIIFPSDNVSYYQGGKYSSSRWEEKPMFLEGEEAKRFEGKSFSVFMPMEINGEVKNYTFTFDVKGVSY
jgi:hypothetical protein